MNYNQPITILTKRPITPQTYENIIINNEPSIVNTEFVISLNQFDFINSHVLQHLINILSTNSHIDGIYSDVLAINNQYYHIITNLAYNSIYINKYLPASPIIFRNKYKTIQELYNQGFLLHIPLILFHNGQTNT